MIKKIAAISLTAVAVIAFATGCGKGSVDVETTGADKVAGTDTLHRFCDNSVLIYVSVISSNPDEYEAFFFGGCAWDEASKSFLPAIGPDTEPRTSPTDSGNDEMNQQDNRQED